MNPNKRQCVEIEEKEQAEKEPWSSFRILMEKTCDFNVRSETDVVCNYSELLRDLYVICHQLNSKCVELNSRIMEMAMEKPK